jgi:D-alanine-D-alanine ligase
MNEHHNVMQLPTALSGPQTEELLRMAKQAFLILDLSGLARVDFFLGRNDGRIYINEVNTLPGFMQDSVYPKLWSASNLALSPRSAIE